VRISLPAQREEQTISNSEGGGYKIESLLLKGGGGYWHHRRGEYSSSEYYDINSEAASCHIRREGLIKAAKGLGDSFSEADHRGMALEANGKHSH